MKASRRAGAALVSSPGQLAALLPAANPLLQRRYQDLTRKHIHRLFQRLFAEFTGLHFHVDWAPPLPHRWTDTRFRTRYALCRRKCGPAMGSGRHCEACGLRNLQRTLRAAGKGHYFKCGLGVHNYWSAIQVRTVTVGIAYLQAMDDEQSRLADDHAARFPVSKAVSRLEFRRAAGLLRLIVQHVQILDLAELRKEDLTKAGHSALALEKEQARLRQVLQRHLPLTPAVIRQPKPACRAEQVVRGLLDYIEGHYAKPITLQRYADGVRMNAAYLSDLFSHAVRMPFKSYLTELRLRKACELLGASNRNVSEVATAVGYASDNRFRVAFKKATGLCPKLWRETMQTQVSVTPPSP